ncbi:MAG: membrane protein insertion efficiency factor YidD [bacterium]
MAYFVIFLVRIYQCSLSPVLTTLGVGCRYVPRCSEYAVEALRLHGARRGSILAVGRVLRCHPWQDGGYDPVPEKQR